MTTTRLATFSVGDMLLGITVDLVQEVLRGPTVTPVPLAPHGLVGLLNLRGQILTVVDVRTPLGLPGACDLDGATHCVVRGRAGAVSLVVDCAHDVVELDPASVTEVPATVPSAVRAHLTGVHAREDGLLLVVDLDRLLDSAYDQDEEATKVRVHAGVGD